MWKQRKSSWEAKAVIKQSLSSFSRDISNHWVALQELRPLPRWMMVTTSSAHALDPRLVGIRRLMLQIPPNTTLLPHQQPMRRKSRPLPLLPQMSPLKTLLWKPPGSSSLLSMSCPWSLLDTMQYMLYFLLLKPGVSKTDFAVLWESGPSFGSVT